MLTLLLVAVASLSSPRVIEVDVIEFNQYRVSPTEYREQLLLYRWTWFHDRYVHRIAQWMLVTEEPRVVRHAGFYRLNLGDVTIVSKSYRVTRTTYDPDRLDQVHFPTERQPYFPYVSLLPPPIPVPDPVPNAGP